ncbi:MAG: hypothetical protein DRP42_06985 [Tenericutes bacterium]|nr:MAG: hypothetical protein DRP42_06985 [Mycoplasmatota bacterium]
MSRYRGWFTVGIVAFIVLWVLISLIIPVPAMMNIFKFLSPIFMALVMVGLAYILSELGRLNDWQKTGRADIPPHFVKLYPPHTRFINYFMLSGFGIVVLLLAAYAHFGLAFIWLCILIARSIGIAVYIRIYKHLPPTHRKGEK